MTSNTAELCRQARELALQHSLTIARTQPKYIWNQFHADIESLRGFVISLQDNHAGCAQSAEEWLLDNAEFLEEQALEVRMRLDKNELIHLPLLHKKGVWRIHSLCDDYLEQVDGVLNEESFVSYLNAYQEVSVLTLAETWSIPLILRVSLIGKLADTMKLVRDRREVCKEVEHLLSRIEPSKLNSEVIHAELDAAGKSAPLSGPWIVHLISHLREWAGDSTSVREWLICKYENGSEDLDRIVTYEHQLQAAYQMTAGNLITSLRKNERRDGNELFEQISLLDRTFRHDSTGIYPLLDAYSRNELLIRVEGLARRMRVPENLVASQAIALAKEELEGLSEVHDLESDLPRPAFAAYYLFEAAGIKKLMQSLRQCSDPRHMPSTGILQRATGTYFGSLIGLFVIVLIAAALWIGSGNHLSPLGWVAVLLVLAFPVSEWVIAGFHFGIERVCRPHPLLRYDLSNGIPADAATMVVIPAIWSSTEEVDELADHLEIHYLANRDANIHYALLGDFTDAGDQHLPEDEKLVAFGMARIEKLNKMYASSGETIFHYFQRRREWNPSEGVFMGWERKRGKLVEFVELLKGSTETSYDFMKGSENVLPPIRYIITLDADTQLPIGSAQRMIGTMHLPYNRPRLNKTRTRVVEGYGVLQPRIGVSHESAMRSRLAYLWSEPGLDPYAFAASDPYQDALAQGIFTGKGIFDVDVFAELLCERIPENKVLSHDLLEGGFLRAALLSDIELIDDHPATFLSYQKRMHRWVRGDWQLICWLFTHVCDRRGAVRPIDLSFLTRWQIIDNLRRSLLPIAYFVLLALALTVLPGSPGRWLAIGFATLLIPVIRQLYFLVRANPSPRRLLSTAVQVLIDIWTLPFQSAVLLDAIGRTLYRLWISKRQLLEWTSSSQFERNKGSNRPALLGNSGGYALIVLFALVTILQPQLSLMWAGLVLSLFWALAPIAVRWLDKPIMQEEEELEPAEKEQLRGLAEQIWAFYEDFSGAKDNYLPPDNVQIEPSKGIAHRTSPTNIGFLLTAVLAAREFGFINTREFVERLDRTVSTVERMDKWNGHLYNWYDTVSLAVLPPAYVSTVDSGNFVASMMTVKQGLAHWLQEALASMSSEQANQTLGGIRGELQVEFATELAQIVPEELALEKLAEQHGNDDATDRESSTVRSEASQTSANNWIVRGQELINRLEKLITSTDFRSLYNAKAKLFVLGYHGDSGQPDNILYDLLASEARQTSFVAIALGQISVSHWMALGRTVKKQGNQTTLVSWSGTMFEYMMPWLIMRTYRNTLWDSTYRGVVQRQIEYARERGVPFGVSESGYYAFDYQMNYQYRAFGVPGLGFKRGLEEDLVVTPYATIMALPFAVQEGLAALLHMEKLGARGQYGFFEAIDFTAGRMPAGESFKVIRSFMAHHQGMSLLTLANMLLPTKMFDYFHRDKRVQAAELLLIERIPPRDAILERELSGKSSRVEQPKPAQIGPLREFLSEDTPVPEVNVHSNGLFTSVVSNSGSGFLRYDGLALSRWREDPIADPWGSYMYIKDVTRNKLWSPTFQPCRVPAANQSVQFSQERTTFQREDEDIQTKLEITVSPESNAEIRRLTLTNKGDEARIIEVTTFLEIALASPDADKAHPAFTKLFIETEYEADEECLLARKRPRNEGEKSVWAFHTLAVGDRSLGPVEFETDRARFIGRGHTLARPRGLETRLGGTVGSVADPAFVMRRRLSMEPHEIVHLISVTGAAATKEQAIEIASQLSHEEQANRAFQLAWTRSQIELQHLHIQSADAAVYQMLAGRALFHSPLRAECKESIAANVKGQQGLWAYGVSGDRPIVMLRVADTSNLSFVTKLLVGYEYLRHNGLFIDLVIFNESVEGYQQDLREALVRMVEQIVGGQGAGQDGVHILPAPSLTDEDKALLFAVSRVVLRADGPSLRAQLQVICPSRALEEPLPLQITAPPNRYPSVIATEDRSDYLFYNGMGGFSPDGREYHIVLKNGNHLPAPWINVIANPRFGCLTSELYTGYTWWRNSRECKLTPWSNDPALDPPGEVCYLRDEESGEYWQMAPSRMNDTSTYKVSYGRGYTCYEHESHGLQQEMTVFVPLEDPVKVIQLRLHNTTNETRKLSVTYYAEWVLGVNREGNASFIVTDWDEGNGILTARNTYQENFRDAMGFLTVYSQMEEDPVEAAKWAEEGRQTGERASSMEQTWTGDRQEFLGRNGTYEDPAAMSRANLSGMTGSTYEACGAVQSKLVIKPGEERTVYILLGCEDSHESAAQLANKYHESHACEQALEDVQKFWDDVLGTISVSTPCPEMDVMLNNWLLYQTLCCRMWARSAFYQAGGAFGFRDQLQDSLALLHSRPDITRAQILLNAGHQYEEGDVQHWWHEETHRGIRTRFSDDLLWLPYAVVRYLEHTEDESILEEIAPYLHSESLGEDEHERYEPTVLSEQSGTILDHCIRALDRSLRFGEHGLPLMGVGDWNDGMSLIGPKGRGESVWLGWFLGDILRGFADLCEHLGKHELADHYRIIRGQLANSLNEAGWDGQWYRRAFTDGGQWLGSIHNEECRIDSIAQSWSVISGMAPEDRALQAMRSFDRELVDRSLAVAHILTPPFDKTDPSPGYIQGYPPGIRENGGQYTHGVIWSIIAWCGLGDGDKAFELFHMFNPIMHTKTSAEVRKYVGEPYVMAADVYTEEPHKGHAGWTWYTGASGWMYQAGIEWILGLRRRGKRLFIKPCIPTEWPEFSVSYRYGDTEYHITVKNPSHKSSGQSMLTIDEVEMEMDKNSTEDGPFVRLEDDHQVHRVVLTL
ncbi:glycosyl transferase [Paenibacillus baekrokdamisoli]|uniref:Glycosyl transferase n=1 Tax=Paenibacillus baekrokdamisoli TaxID=1712516 RepID=A0A3G9J924_9BACL|nr:glucoamylase family protein [Paenibacillus baekrokdamisoli]MBB3072617.1 cellobiose phosphorylase [Paenibacillus baekrokdamisoli]BBH22331.1 glycosyl transferase [Paenibacillus baekrokdamisoli]